MKKKPVKINMEKVNKPFKSIYSSVMELTLARGSHTRMGGSN